MKKAFILLFIISTSLWTTAFPAWAVTPTPIKSGATPTTTSVSPTDKPSLVDQINSLKEKIASRVAQLKLVAKKGVIGTVDEVSSSQINIVTSSGDTRFIDVDEITKFTNASAKGTFGISDLKKGMRISVLGLYNKESRRILARFIDVVVYPEYLTGTITAINRPDYSFTLTSADNKTTTIDIESYTKSTSFTGATAVKIGFTKLQTSEHVVIIGTRNKKDATRVSADRILVFPDISSSETTSSSSAHMSK